MCADEKVRQAALDKLDNHILALTNCDLVAGKDHYHKSCYCNYMRDVKQKPANNNNMECDEAAYKAVEHEAY